MSRRPRSALLPVSLPPLRRVARVRLTRSTSRSCGSGQGAPPRRARPCASIPGGPAPAGPPPPHGRSLALLRQGVLGWVPLWRAAPPARVVNPSADASAAPGGPSAAGRPWTRHRQPPSVMIRVVARGSGASWRRPDTSSFGSHRLTAGRPQSSVAAISSVLPGRPPLSARARESPSPPPRSPPGSGQFPRRSSFRVGVTTIPPMDVLRPHLSRRNLPSLHDPPPSHTFIAEILLLVTWN